jgi:excisionase family DNA binding protein
MGEEEKQVETSPTLERKRAKYTVEDVRHLCGGISRSTVMREIRRKRLACYRARRTLRFSEEHVTKYLERVEQGVKWKCGFWRYLCMVRSLNEIVRTTSLTATNNLTL